MPAVLTSVVTGLDALYVLADDPRATADALAAAVGLPIVLPYADHGPYAATALSLGNAVLYVQRWSWLEVQPTPPLRVNGLLLTSADVIAGTAAELDRRSIAHTPPLRYTSPDDGPASIDQTTIDVHGLTDAALEVVIVERHAPARPSRPATATSIVEVAVGTRNQARDVAAWSDLLGPPTDPTGRWELASGPAIRLTEHIAPSAVTLVLAAAGVPRRVVDPESTCGLAFEVLDSTGAEQ